MSKELKNSLMTDWLRLPASPEKLFPDSASRASILIPGFSVSSVEAILSDSLLRREPGPVPSDSRRARRLGIFTLALLRSIRPAVAAMRPANNGRKRAAEICLDLPAAGA